MPGPIPAPNPPAAWFYPPAPGHTVSSFTLATVTLSPGDAVDNYHTTVRLVD